MSFGGGHLVGVVIGGTYGGKGADWVLGCSFVLVA